jgi:hypothetical protein
MTFHLEGTYLETCNCDVICPCTCHPVNTSLTVGQGVGSRISLLGIEYSGDGRAGFSAPFSWAA